MRAIPPTLSLHWQMPAHDAGRGGIVFEFNASSAQAAGYPVRRPCVRPGLHMTTLSIALRSGPIGTGPSFCQWQRLADGADHGKFPFSTATDAVESALIKTLTRGSQKWSRNISLLRRSLRSRLRVASKAAVMAIRRPPTARWFALSAVLPRVRSLLMQPAAQKPKARLLAQLQAACPAAFRACLPAIDLPAATARRGLIFDNSKTGSFSHTGWEALFICGAGSGPTLSEGRESRCSRKS